MQPRSLLLYAFLTLCFILPSGCGSQPAPASKQSAVPPEPESLNVQDSVDKAPAPQTCQSI